LIPGNGGIWKSRALTIENMGFKKIRLILTKYRVELFSSANYLGLHAESVEVIGLYSCTLRRKPINL